jgi:hypothetical protein
VLETWVAREFLVRAETGECARKCVEGKVLVSSLRMDLTTSVVQRGLFDVPWPSIVPERRVSHE